MDDTPAKETPAKDFNKLDLSQLQGFSFGTQWTQDKSSPSDQRDRSDRPRRDGGPDRRDGPGGGAPDRRDRRAFRKPAGESSTGGESAPAAAPAGPGSDVPRRDYGADRAPRREFQGGPRRDGPGGAPDRGGQRYGGGGYGARPEVDRGPYDSPFFSVSFYPEDTSFNALAKTIRSSCRTIELFEIARTVIGKVDRFVVVLARRPGSSDAAEIASQPIYLSVPDGLPFESEEAALTHVLSNHLGRFFETAEVEIEPPKGNFQVVNRCGVTGELLGPPNYHRYTQIVQQHFASKVSRMPFEAFRSRIETVRDPEVIAQWLAKMKKATRYTWKQSSKPAIASATAPAVQPETEPVAAPEGSATAEAAVAEVAAQEGTTTPESAPMITFDAFEDARSYLLTNARDKVVRAIETARFHGKLVETMPDGEIRRSIEGALERQRRFPLDTANALRGRLRREHFTIFKKGSKGVSYVCAVKRKFRVPGQTFAETISALITFVEANPMVRASELPNRFLGIAMPVAPKSPEASAAPAAGSDASAAPEASAVSAKPEVVLTIDQRAKFSRMQGDLRWLVTEGYVTEFIDGRLFAAPPVAEARKKEVESEEHDPENFPDVPAAAMAPVAELTPSAMATPENAAVELGVQSPPVDPAPEVVPPVESTPGDATAAPSTETT